jgi:hypothetical protein
MLTQHQRIAVRRHLNIGFAGTGQAGRLAGWRFSRFFEDLEYKMSNMQPSEEQILTGNAMGSYAINGAPAVGDVLTYTLAPASGSPIAASYTVTSNDLNPASNPVNPSEAAPTFSIALNSALAFNAAAQAAGYSAVGAMPADLFSPQYLPPYFAELIVTGPSSTPFALSGSVVGRTNLVVEDPGSVCPVQATFTNPTTNVSETVYGLIAICDFLANAMTQASLSLWLTKADVIAFRPDEVGARRGLYREYCMQLAKAIGGDEYIRKFSGASGGGACA